MDPRLLHYYNLELQHLREMGGEFAQQFPKIAARLGMSGIEVTDPYVERLLEGAGFMAARVQLKLDAEFPRFTQSLLEIVYPHFLAPTPSMLVAQMHPDKDDPSLAGGTRTMPRGTTLHAVAATEDATACEFRTAHDVTLLPLEIVSAGVFFVCAGSSALHAADRPADQGRSPHPAEDHGRRQVRADQVRSSELLPRGPRRRGQQAARALSRDRPRSAGAAGRRPPAGRHAAAGLLDSAGRVHRSGGVASGQRAIVPGLSPASGVFLVPAALPVLRTDGPRAGAQAAAEHRGRAGRAVRPRRSDARERRRFVEPAAVLHAGDQSVRQGADRSHPRQRLDLRIPRRRGSDTAARLRDLRGHRGGRARRRRRRRAAVPAVLFGVQRGRRTPVLRLLHDPA